jgi:hypothetical protein
MRIALALVLLGSGLLAGCITPGPGTRTYLLTPTVEAASPPAAGVRTAAPRTVVIRDVRLPLYLDRPEIVTRDARNGLEISDVELWGGHLREDMERVLATNLGRLLPGDRVIAAPYPVAKAPDYRVEVDIRSFERQPGGRVALAAQWWITRGADGSLLASAEGSFAGVALGTDATYDHIVGSMSAVFGELAQAIARDIPRRGAAGS